MERAWPMTTSSAPRASDDRDDLNANNTETWAHTNVWAGGKLMATDDNTGNGLRFYLVDPLGTHRAQTNSICEGKQTCHLSDEALLVHMLNAGKRLPELV